MPRKRTETHCLKQPAELDSLASPVRMEIIGAMGESGPCSIRELAERMGRPADGLYHHVRVLLGAGVLVQQGSRKAGRRTEAVYALAAKRIAGALQPASPESKRAVTRAAAAALRLAAREFAAAIESGAGARRSGPRRIRASRQKVWLNDGALAELGLLLERVEAFLVRHCDRKAGRPYALTTVLAPIIKKGRI
jgi:DNA-binding MarR family transcriptional regulator